MNQKCHHFAIYKKKYEKTVFDITFVKTTKNINERFLKRFICRPIGLKHCHNTFFRAVMTRFMEKITLFPII